MASTLEANAAAFLAVLLLGVSALLLTVSGLSWSRLRHPRLLFVTAAFAILTAKGAFASWRALQGAPGDLAALGLDIVLVLLLYAGVAKR
jgi:hypothetical protein